MRKFSGWVEPVLFEVFVCSRGLTNASLRQCIVATTVGLRSAHELAICTRLATPYGELALLETQKIRSFRERDGWLKACGTERVWLSSR